MHGAHRAASVRVSERGRRAEDALFVLCAEVEAAPRAASAEREDSARCKDAHGAASVLGARAGLLLGRPAPEAAS